MNHMVHMYVWIKLHTLFFKHGQATDKQSCEEAAWRIQNVEICLKSQYQF